MPSTSWLCLSPFTDAGKAQREQPSAEGEPSPADSDLGPSALPLPWSELEGSLGLVLGLVLEGKLVPPPQLSGRLSLVFHLPPWVL